MRGIFRPCNSLQNISCSGKLRCHYREAFSSTKSPRPRYPRRWWRRMTPALVPGPRPSAELTPSSPPCPWTPPPPPSPTACPGTCSHGASCTTCPGCTGGCRHPDIYNICTIYIISALHTLFLGASQMGATGGINATTILVDASRINLYN